MGKTKKIVRKPKWKSLSVLALPIISMLIFFIIAEITTRIFVDESEFIIEMNGEFFGMKNLTINKSNGLYYQNNGSLINRYILNHPLNHIGVGSYRVAIIGDSFTGGAGVRNPNQSYVSQLSNMLDKDYEILAFGDGGLNTYQEYIILKDLALTYKPDMVILQFCPNDGDPTRTGIYRDREYFKSLFTDSHYIITSDKRKIVPSFPFLSESFNRFVLHSAFMRFLSYKFNSILYNKNIDSENINLSLDSVKEIHSLLNGKNIPLIIIGKKVSCVGNLNSESEIIDKNEITVAVKK